MPVPDFSVGEVLTAAAMDRVAMWTMTPTSVAGTGVSLSGATTVFTASTSVSLNGCFTSDFRRYRVEINWQPTAGQVLYWRLRAAGTDASANNYSYLVSSRTFAAAAQTNLNGSLLSTSVIGNGSTNQPGFVTFDIDAPQLAARTTLHGNATWDLSTAYIGSQHTLATAYDGMTIFLASAGTMTGRINVYGYRD